MLVGDHVRWERPRLVRRQETQPWGHLFPVERGAAATPHQGILAGDPLAQEPSQGLQMCKTGLLGLWSSTNSDSMPQPHLCTSPAQTESS